MSAMVRITSKYRATGTDGDDGGDERGGICDGLELVLEREEEEEEKKKR